ncbi:MAG: guanylate kinase [Desulfopila sp.]|jgi:guanylate kinase|nr:guanylate kinase [Desulfopila sp.]
MSRGKFFILSAPSGTGKSTVLKKVMSNIQGVAFSISHTTRQPRQGESDGVEYHFVDQPTFTAMRKKNDFLEYAEVHGNFYGTSREGVAVQIDSGVDVILDIDVQGAEIIKKSGEIDAAYIFLMPPSLEELEERLRSRGLDSDETIQIRLRNAAGEMKAMDQFDYVIVNDTVDNAVRMFESVILAERARSRRHITGETLCGGPILP